MSASTLRAYFGLYHEHEGVTRPFCSQFAPVEKAGTGPQAIVDARTIAAASGYVLIWDGNATGAPRDWSAFSLRIRGEGTLHLKWQKDAVTSENDLSFTGASEQDVYDSMSCLLPHCKDMSRVYLNNGSTLGKWKRLYAKTTDEDPVTVDFTIME